MSTLENSSVCEWWGFFKVKKKKVNPNATVKSQERY